MTVIYTFSMTTIKTAVSIEKELFHQVEELAGELQVSRSRLVSLALSAFIERHETQKLVDKLNEVYADGNNAEDKEYLEAMWSYHVETTKDDRW